MNAERKLIAIDFDDTWTTAPEFWTDVFCISPFDFVLATMRSETAENIEEIDKLVPLEIPRVFCGGQFKGPIVQSKGYAVDIWIDDAPGFIWGNAWNPCVTLRDVVDAATDTERNLTDAELAGEAERLEWLKLIDHLEDQRARLASALRLLHDYQNGCPLETWRPKWEEAMRRSIEVLQEVEQEDRVRNSIAD